jgi:hypothetical protein
MKPVHVSYCHSNSHNTTSKGTPQTKTTSELFPALCTRVAVGIVELLNAILLILVLTILIELNCTIRKKEKKARLYMHTPAVSF